jgi:small-conductance mechanosensitive channel
LFRIGVYGRILGRIAGEQLLGGVGEGARLHQPHIARLKILTDSNALLKVPNSNVTASLIMNLSHGRQGHVAMQVEVPLAVDPDDLRNRLKTLLSEMKEFKGEEVSFDILEMPSIAYLVALNYTVDRKNEAEMKWLIFRALRLALTRAQDKASK